MEPFLPGNSFYYSKAEEEVKLFLANYANWLRDLRKALAIASQQNENRKIDFLTKRIRHIETRKMRLDALRTIANPSDSSRKVVSF
jgi:DNA-binding ferritin-like protein